MSTLLSIQLTAAIALAVALMLWFVLARQLRRDGLGRWRAAPLGLLLSVAAIGYGVFWTLFFSSPGAAVQMHAIRLTAQQAIGSAWPWVIVALVTLALLPLLRWVRQELG